MRIPKNVNCIKITGVLNGHQSICLFFFRMPRTRVLMEAVCSPKPCLHTPALSGTMWPFTSPMSVQCAPSVSSAGHSPAAGAGTFQSVTSPRGGPGASGGGRQGSPGGQPSRGAAPLSRDKAAAPAVPVARRIFSRTVAGLFEFWST